MRSKENHKYLFLHKNSKSEYIHKTSTQLNYSIPCINCDCLIPFTDVDQHSQCCQKISVYKYSNIKEYAAIQETDLKIKKLKQSIITQYVQEEKSQNKKYLMRSEELCNSILGIKETDEKQVKNLQDIEQEIKLLIENYQGQLLIQLFLERLHSLCLVKLSNLKQIFKLSSKRNIQESTSSTQLSKKIHNSNYNIYLEEEKISQNSRNLNQKESSDGYLFSMKEQSSSKTEKINRQTLITKFSQEQQQTFNQNFKNEILTRMTSSQCDDDRSYQDINKEDLTSYLQRVFYSKCLNQKAKLPNNHFAQKIPLSVLHKEALNKNIPIQQWDEFISEAYQRPEQFLDKQKLFNKIQSHNQLSSRQLICNSNLRERVKNMKAI